MRTVDTGLGWCVVDTTDGRVFRPRGPQPRIRLTAYNEPRSFAARKLTDDAWSDLFACDRYIKQMEEQHVAA